MLRPPPTSTLFPTRRSSDLRREPAWLIPLSPAPEHATQRSNASFETDRKSTRLNSSHDQISYAVFCLKKKKTAAGHHSLNTTRSPYIRRRPEFPTASTLYSN